MLAAVAAGIAAGSLAAGLAAALVLTLSLHRFFFPSRFTIDGQEIRADYLMSRKRLRWTEVRRFACDRRGGYLSTRGRPSRLDAFRGLHILFDDRREEQIGEILRRMAESRGSRDENGEENGQRSCRGQTS